jgi:hypothetical protein
LIYACFYLIERAPGVVPGAAIQLARSSAKTTRFDRCPPAFFDKSLKFFGQLTSRPDGAQKALFSDYGVELPALRDDSGMAQQIGSSTNLFIQKFLILDTFFGVGVYRKRHWFFSYKKAKAQQYCFARLFYRFRFLEILGGKRF